MVDKVGVSVREAVFSPVCDKEASSTLLSIAQVLNIIACQKLVYHSGDEVCDFMQLAKGMSGA